MNLEERLQSLERFVAERGEPITQEMIWQTLAKELFLDSERALDELEERQCFIREDTRGRQSEAPRARHAD